MFIFVFFHLGNITTRGIATVPHSDHGRSGRVGADQPGGVHEGRGVHDGVSANYYHHSQHRRVPSGKKLPTCSFQETEMVRSYFIYLIFFEIVSFFNLGDRHVSRIF